MERELSVDNITLFNNDDISLKDKIIKSRNTNKDYFNKYKTLTLEDILKKEFIEDNIPEVIVSSKIILKHLEKHSNIILIVDFDMDGVTSGAVGYKMFTSLLKHKNINIIVNKREYGYGINDTIVDTVSKYVDVDLVLTSDHGSNDGSNLLKIKENLNCEVIVTDHHLFKEELSPIDIDVFINPQQYDNDFKEISGTFVLYYTLLHCFYIKVFKESRVIQNDELDYIHYLLTYVGATTISDCMDLKNYINRLVIKKMVYLLNSKYTNFDNFWKLMLKHLNISYILDETTIGFDVAPLINSPGRIGEPRLSYEVMVNGDDELFKTLIKTNKIRKSLQKKVIDDDSKIEYSDGIVSIILVDNAEGIQGIVASNVMYKNNYKISIVLTPHKIDGEIILSGSGRALDNSVDLKGILDSINNNNDILIKYGGHKGAIGCKIINNVEKFFNLIKDEVKSREMKKVETTYIDGYLETMSDLVITTFTINSLKPFGIGYVKPLFVSDVTILKYNIYNKTFVILEVLFKDDINPIKVFYNINDKNDFIASVKKSNKKIRLVYNISINSYLRVNSIVLNGINLIFI